ncbi:alcohol dehydrogenase catalytic domain-containing protein [Streptomyces sp. M19]
MTDWATIEGTMRAARFDAASRTLSVQDVPVPVPGPGEVLVKVAACGICHSDLGQLLGYIKPVLDAVTRGTRRPGPSPRSVPG